MKHRLLTSPFPRNGCVPLAYSAVSGECPTELARQAMKTRRPIRDGHMAYRWLLQPSYAGYTFHTEDARVWARLVRCDVAEVIRFGMRWGCDEAQGGITTDPRRVTLATFCREHPRGRFVLIVKSGKHALAVVNGVSVDGNPRGPRQRVLRAFRIIPQEAP